MTSVTGGVNCSVSHSAPPPGRSWGLVGSCLTVRPGSVSVAFKPQVLLLQVCWTHLTLHLLRTSWKTLRGKGYVIYHDEGCSSTWSRGGWGFCRHLRSFSEPTQSLKSESNGTNGRWLLIRLPVRMVPITLTDMTQQSYRIMSFLLPSAPEAVKDKPLPTSVSLQPSARLRRDKLSSALVVRR